MKSTNDTGDTLKAIDARLSRIEAMLNQLLINQPLPKTPLEQRIKDGLAKGMTPDEILEEHNRAEGERTRERLEEIMSEGAPANAYIHRRRCYRVGVIYKGEFYYYWGSNIRSLPVGKVDMEEI